MTAHTKKCFVIMPISDLEGYGSGHFGRVYDYIIKPACDLAELEPIRADDIMTTNYIALDIIKHIINSEMAICDLSGPNPNVLYELGIRQAFNLPVTLIKDQKTNRIFDIQGFRDVEYDESLRIDNVQDIVETLSETLKNTYENTHEINSLVSLLGIEPAKVTTKTKISSETKILLNALSGLDKRMGEIEKSVQPFERTLVNSRISNVYLPDNVGDIISKQEIENLKVGEKLFHDKFGIGEVMSLSDRPWVNKTGQIKFESGNRLLVLRLARLRKFK
jgi:hypothetical protein